MRREIEAAFAFVVLSTTPAFSAGYGLKEASTDAMGASYAGAAAGGSDASYMAYNPAALGLVTDFDFSVSAVSILPGSRADFTTALTSAGTLTGGGTKPSGFISDALVPAFAVRQRLSDQWTIGLSINAPWGLRTIYPLNWAGRYYAEKSELLTIDITPTIAWQPTPDLIVGAGVQIEYAQGTLTSAIDTGTIGFVNGIPGAIPGAQDSFARLSGNSWSEGFVVGAIDKISDNVTIGLSYHSSVQHDLNGPLTFKLDDAGIGATLRAITGAFTNTRAMASITMPDMIDAGIHADLSDQWSVMAELDWTDWSRFHNLTILAENPAQPPDITETHWHNTVFGSFGGEYRYNPDWTFHGGVGYDESPTRDATREPRIPDADRVWLSLGVRYRLNENIDLDLSAARLFNVDEPIGLSPATPANVLRGTLVGTTSSYVNVLGFELSWRSN